MKIKPMSDLHLEFADFEINNDEGADVLVLAGDIIVAELLKKYPIDDEPDMFDMSPQANDQRKVIRFRQFFKQCAELFPHVVMVAGNHEFYRGRLKRSMEVLRGELNHYQNFYLLDNEQVIINNVVFVGATLWTDYNKGDPLTKFHVLSYMNDYKHIKDDTGAGIRKLHPNTLQELHRASVEYIDSITLHHRDKFVLAVSHHSPSFKSVVDQYANDPLMNGAYHSDLSELILNRENIRYWIHGHSHACVDYMIGQCNVICNPRGYPGENGKFVDRVVEL